MDANDAYVGAHSPQVILDTSTPHGIRQAGLGLKAGKQYAGRVILAADPGAQINVSLISRIQSWRPSDHSHPVCRHEIRYISFQLHGGRRYPGCNA